MKWVLVVALALMVLLSSRSAVAEKNFYLLGGATLANLGGDAEQFGNELADSLESQIGGSWTSNKKMRSGFDVGVGFGYSHESPWGGAVEVHYAQRGAKWELTQVAGSGVHLDMEMKLAYVEIPLLLRVTPGSSKTRGVFFAGPVLGIRASSKLEVSANGASASEDLSDAMKSTYFAGLVGAGLDWRVSPGSSLLLQGRFQLGLSNLIDDPTFNVKPQDFSLLVGYSTNL